jgi:hypothetical protein
MPDPILTKGNAMPAHRRVYLVIMLCSAAACAAANPAAVLRHGGLFLEIYPESGVIATGAAESGLVLAKGTIHLSESEETSPYAPLEIRDRNAETLTVLTPDGHALRLCLTGGMGVQLRPERENGAFVFKADSALGGRAMPAILAPDQDTDRGVLLTRLGNAAIPGAAALYDPDRDLAVRTGGSWAWQDGWKLCAPFSQAAPLRIQCFPHYYRDVLGIIHYTPFRPRAPWRTAPAVALTWYGLRGWEGDPAQRKDWLYPQIDWAAENLLPWAGTLVFQIDDNYLYTDDTYMRDLSAYIREKGLVPGIWFPPFGIAPPEDAAAHPGWFLHDGAGDPLTAFAGINWRDPSRRDRDNFILNTGAPEAVEKRYAPFWRKLCQTWDFDFFKIDGQPTVAARYRRAAGANGIAGYREGLRIARRLAGPDRFINGCFGIPLDGIGFMDGARTGPDAGGWHHAMEIITKFNYLNHICWWCDPDAAANQYEAPLHLVRLNAQARVLTGQQYVTDDVWTEVPDTVRAIWRRSLPTLPIWPVNLYPIAGQWPDYDIYQLRIHRAGRTWDAAGFYNFHAAPKAKQFDLSRLALPGGPVHVYEAWAGDYLGVYAADAAIPRQLDGHQAELFAIVPATDNRPALLSTSRHLSLGGLELESLAWTRTSTGWRVAGRSSHLVADDPYTLVFAHAGYTRINAGKSESAAGEKTACITLVPQADGALDWTAAFARP